jgi:transposase-like protein
VSPFKPLAPKLLLRNIEEAATYFSEPDNCVQFVASHRWPDGVVTCPFCGSKYVRYISTRALWECTEPHAQAQFSVRSGTLLEESHITLKDWLITAWVLANSPTPVSSYQLSTHLGITQKSAWALLRRIGAALAITGSAAPGINQGLYGGALHPRSQKVASK